MAAPKLSKQERMLQIMQTWESEHQNFKAPWHEDEKPTEKTTACFK